MICLDEKATVPVEEPGRPQAMEVCGHNHSLAPVDGPLLSAMDHDFHLAGIIPSVAFILDIQQTRSSMDVCWSHAKTRYLSSFHPSNMVLRCVVFWRTTFVLRVS